MREKEPRSLGGDTAGTARGDTVAAIPAAAEEDTACRNRGLGPRSLCIGHCLHAL